MRWTETTLLLLVSASSVAGYLYWRGSEAPPSQSSIAAVDEPAGASGTSVSERALPTERTPLAVPQPGDADGKPAAGRKVRLPQRLPRRGAESTGGSQSDVEAEMRRVSITMYGTRWCGVCAQARQWMSSKGYRYSELDVDSDESAKEARDRLAPRGGVPVFIIGGQLLDGFSPGAFERKLRRAAEKNLRR